MNDTVTVTLDNYATHAPETCTVDGCYDEPDWAATECYDHVHEDDDASDPEVEMGDFDTYHAWARNLGKG